MSLIYVDFAPDPWVLRGVMTHSPDTLLEPVRPVSVRYIKLGRGNSWFEHCRANSVMSLGQHEVPHDVAERGDAEEIASFYEGQGRSRSKARDFTRELLAFYTLGADCLWITFADDRLWWAFADPGVHESGCTDGSQGERYRKVIGGWRATGIHGQPLIQSQLSSRLTRVAAYRQTICRVEAEDYLVRRINEEVEPIVAEALTVQGDMVSVTGRMISNLHWTDFEVLADLIFARGGWHRVSALGGGQKGIDLALEQPITGEKAFVQVKSAATAAILAQSVAAFRASSYDRMMFVCHSFTGVLPEPDDDRVAVWTGDQLARLAIRSGLFDWLVRRVG